MGAKLLYKAGQQSEADPFVFVMSTPTPDRAGDIVVQNWKLRNFRRNPIALWSHQNSQPIGAWKNVSVQDGNLVGRLELAARGTSQRIDELRGLVEQRILRAVSVGFIPESYEPLDPEDPWGGYLLDDNELLECSLCSIPMNPDALSQVRTMSIRSARGIFNSAHEPAYLSARHQLKLLDASGVVPGSSARVSDTLLQDAREAVEQARSLLNRGINS